MTNFSNKRFYFVYIVNKAQWKKSKDQLGNSARNRKIILRNLSRAGVL